MTMNPNVAKQALSASTGAFMPVHLLGFPCNMIELMDLAEAKDLFVIEDACGAHAAEASGRKVGSFADFSTFSFFFSHHITTIEGGIVLTNNEEFCNLARSLRAHGWIRERTDREDIAKRYPCMDKRFLFINTGFSFRPTEIQGPFGIHQIEKLPRILQARRDNAQYRSRRLSKFADFLIFLLETRGIRPAWFGYPITIKPSAPFSRDALVTFLESRGIETRPITAGNIAEQPAMKFLNHKICGQLKNARMLTRNSFFFGNHCGVREAERQYIAECIEEFVESEMR